jgi:hypothetical protein
VDLPEGSAEGTEFIEDHDFVVMPKEKDSILNKTESTAQLKYFDDAWCIPRNDILERDICVYGGNAAGVLAAVTAAEEGKSVVILHPGLFLGGMTTGGLSYTDLGNPAAIGGGARRFYEAIGKIYDEAVSWTFEPHVATQVVEHLVTRSDIDLQYGEFVEDVSIERNRIVEIRMHSGLRIKAKAYIDASYEGDLMARTGTPYVTGREGSDEFGEEYAGVQLHPSHQFDNRVSPYVREDDPGSGLLPFVKPAGIRSQEELNIGRADSSIQAYNFRVCMTKDRHIRVPFPRPAGYDRGHYALVARWLAGTAADVFFKFDPVTEAKTDTNNHGAASTDYIGGSHAWPEADYRTRELIFQDHVRYQQGLHWFMANDPDVPESIRSEYSQWGLASDEFPATGGWPHQLYVREARRMRSDAVVTESDCMGRNECGDPIALAAYQMDSHNCNRLDVGGIVKNEGDVQIKLPAPYGVSYRAIVPPVGHVENLFVPVCLSASHIAYGSVRMEPVFMIIAESAAVAACQCIDTAKPAQELPYGELHTRLVERGQVLRTNLRNTERINP